VQHSLTDGSEDIITRSAWNFFSSTITYFPKKIFTSPGITNNPQPKKKETQKENTHGDRFNFTTGSIVYQWACIHASTSSIV
jgi:hypothetical protein